MSQDKNETFPQGYSYPLCDLHPAVNGDRSSQFAKPY